MPSVPDVFTTEIIDRKNGQDSTAVGDVLKPVVSEAGHTGADGWPMTSLTLLVIFTVLDGTLVSLAAFVHLSPDLLQVPPCNMVANSTPCLDISKVCSKVLLFSLSDSKHHAELVLANSECPTIYSNIASVSTVFQFSIPTFNKEKLSIAKIQIIYWIYEFWNFYFRLIPNNYWCDNKLFCLMAKIVFIN